MGNTLLPEADTITRTTQRRTILIFIDGLGWGSSDPGINPCGSYGGEIFGLPERPLDGAPIGVAKGGWARPIDAVLGVEGIPQSATGQTTLLTGVSAQGLLGKHLTGFPNPRLRDLLMEKSILKVMTDRGHRARFLNAFRPLFWKISREQQLRLSATTVANLAGDLPFFDLDDITAGRSIYQEFTNTELIDRGFEVPVMTPRQAGMVLASQARLNDFTLFEYFMSDKAGHTGDAVAIRAELAKLDEFVAAVLQELEGDLEEETLVLITSDHGNLEDATTRRHTVNPIPVMAWGESAREFVAGIERLDQVAGAILSRHPV